MNTDEGRRHAIRLRSVAEMNVKYMPVHEALITAAAWIEGACDEADAEKSKREKGGDS